MRFIHKTRKALYDVNNDFVFRDVLDHVSYVLARYFSIYKNQKELPRGIFDLFLEMCNTPELYNKRLRHEFIDCLCLFSEKQKQKVLNTVLKNFNDYIIKPKMSFLFNLFLTIKCMYEPYCANPVIIDFYARLYLSATGAGKAYLEMDFFVGDWSAVEARIKELKN